MCSRSLTPRTFHAIPPPRPESEAPPPVSERNTDPDGPGPILAAMAVLSGKVDKLESGQAHIVNELLRVVREERRFRLASHAMPWVVVAFSLAMSLEAFASLWIVARTWQEIAEQRREPVVVTLRQEPAPAVWK